jgi:hypothetical protein
VNRLVGAEFLKLRKRRALFWWTLVLTVGVVTLVYGIIEILHLADPVHHGPAGGIDGLRGSMLGLSLAGGIAAILVGAAAGTADVSAGVFRDLVATGRPRRELFAARAPGALAFFLPMITLGYVVIAVCSVTLVGSGHATAGIEPAINHSAPGAGLILRGYGWVVLSTGFDLLLALGLSSLIGSRGTTIGVLIGWQHLASPLLAQLSLIGRFRQAMYTAALDRLTPLGPSQEPLVVRSAAVAAVVLIGWLAVFLAAGGWRTVARDA